MNRFSAVIVPIPIVVFIYMLMTFNQYNLDMSREFSRRVQDVQVNYASDAAVDEMLMYSEDLSMDYNDMDFAKLNPEVGVDTFSTIMVKSKGISLSSDNLTNVRANNIKSVVVAALDGFYLGSPKQFNSSGAYDLVFMNKMPYMYKDGVKTYTLNMSYKNSLLFSNNSITRVTAPINEKQQRIIISQRITEALMSEVYKQTDNNMMESIYIPPEITALNSTNPIDKITFLCYYEDDFGFYGTNNQSFGIGGSRVTRQRVVGVYNMNYGDGMRPYYIFMDKLPTGYTVNKIYESSEEAARHGYYYDTNIQ